MSRTTLLAAVAAGALLLPAGAAAAKNPDVAKGGAKVEAVSKAKKGKSKKAKKVKTFTYTLSGVYQGSDAVLVKKGNAFVKRAKLVGQTLTFDFSNAKVSVADVDGDGVAGLADVQAGDRVVVQFRAPRTLADDATLAARKLVDQTHPEVDDEDETEDGDAVVAPVAPAAG